MGTFVACKLILIVVTTKIDHLFSNDDDAHWQNIPPNSHDGLKHIISINHDTVHPEPEYTSY